MYHQNIYKQKFTPTHFSCSCPDHILKKGFCKHLLFLLARVANLNEIAAIVCESKYKWGSEFFDICSQQWTIRILNLGKKNVKQFTINKTASIPIATTGGAMSTPNLKWRT